MSTLDALALKYGCDKASNAHGYASVYDPLFTPLRHQPVTLLELGVADGWSIRMWREYFYHPETRIFGIDNDPDRRCTVPFDTRVSTFLSDQTVIPPELEGVDFDIVIDDASHVSEKTIGSFFTWYPAVKDHGYYIIEDVTCSYDERYGGCPNPDAPPDDGGWTTMQFLRRLTDEVHAHAFIPPEEENRINYQLESITFHPDLVVMQKAPVDAAERLRNRLISAGFYVV